MIDFRSEMERLLEGRLANWALLLVAYMLWCAGDAADVVVAFSELQFHMGATWIGWKSQMPVWAWLAGGLGIATGFGRSMLLVEASEPGRLRLGSAFVVGAVVVRAASLVGPVGQIFPWLGLLWSPAAALTMGGFVGVWANWRRFSIPGKMTHGRIALAVFVIFAFLYSAYGLYFVQTTTLHGDEPQYLLITQSLVEDGDIDLANADETSMRAFNEFGFGIHKAPASPAGRLHNSHPIGLPVLLTVPYVVGDWLWGHPRLGAVFLQTVMTAGACGLVVLFLLKQGFPLRTSVLTTVLMGLSAPLFTQSNQLYPEIQAVLVTLFVLNVFPGWPFGASGRDAGLRSVMLVCAAIVLLPFFHQRHLILALVLAVPVVDTVRRAGFTSTLARSVGGVFMLGLIAHLLYNWHYSGDIWGPFLPGNADTIAPDPVQSIPGQWIDRRVGLLRQAPIYGVVLLGLVGLFRNRSRGVLIAVLFAATAGVNMLSKDWTFGFCYPTRFMVTAIPALALAFAAGLDGILARRRPLALWLVIFAWILSLETLGQDAILPEIGFEGPNLVSRISEASYPTALHFVDFVSGEGLDFGTASFWGLMMLSIWLIRNGRNWVFFGLALAGLAPVLSVQSATYHDLLKGSFAYQIPRYQEEPETWTHTPVVLDVPAGGSAMPASFRGEVEVYPGVQTVPDLKGVRGFHTISSTAMGTSRNGTRHTVPLINQSVQSIHKFSTSGSAVSRPYFQWFGRSLESTTQWVLKASRGPRSWTPVYARDLPAVGDGAPVSMTLGGLEAGHYRLSLVRDGARWSDWFDRYPKSNIVAIFTGFDRVRTDEEGLAKMARRWMEAGWRDPKKPLPDAYFPPQVEARLPHYWAVLPSLGDPSTVAFTMERAGPMQVVVLPDDEVRVTGIRIEVLSP